MPSLVTHLFLPDDSNNQRPRLLHSQAVMIYVVIFFFLQLGFRVGQFVYPNILGYATNITVEDLLALTNQQREENGLAVLNLDVDLSAAAFQKAEDMFIDNYWAHVAPDGTTPWQFIEGSHYSYLYAGENLAKDFADSEGVVAAWMASPTHRDNILKKEYQDIGFAVVNGKLNGEETTLVVQMFGQRKILAQRSPFISAEAAEIEVPTKISPSPILPSPSPAGIKIPSAIAASFLSTGVIKRPLIDIFSLEKTLSMALISLLFLILVVDGVFVLKRKTIRVVGHNIAHLIFLMALIGLLFLTQKGVIL